jgi:redox-sensitive bicupin YhaK (pirin superfamily)
MSYFATEEPRCTAQHGHIELLITPRARDLGGFQVRRVLPSRERRAVGPFVFFDHMGPAEFPPGQGIQVRPHPHIGLATITWLFEGEILHRDSLGFVQPIRPGAVNLMTAGRGIVHSERAGDDLDVLSRLHGIQSWIALPDGKEEIEPAFVHHPAAALPALTVDGVAVTLIMGSAHGQVSPVQTFSPTLYLECRLPAGTRYALPDDAAERAVYVASGSVAMGGATHEAGVMAVACPGKAVVIEARSDSRIMVIGGEPVGERLIFWNFVSSSAPRIEQAKADWEAGRFARVPGDDERIPLPG